MEYSVCDFFDLKEKLIAQRKSFLDSKHKPFSLYIYADLWKKKKKKNFQSPRLLPPSPPPDARHPAFLFFLLFFFPWLFLEPQFQTPRKNARWVACINGFAPFRTKRSQWDVWLKIEWQWNTGPKWAELVHLVSISESCLSLVSVSSPPLWDNQVCNTSNSPPSAVHDYPLGWCIIRETS